MSQPQHYLVQAQSFINTADHHHVVEAVVGLILTRISRPTPFEKTNTHCHTNQLFSRVKRSISAPSPVPSPKAGRGVCSVLLRTCKVQSHRNMHKKLLVRLRRTDEQRQGNPNHAPDSRTTRCWNGNVVPRSGGVSIKASSSAENSREAAVA